MRTCRIGNGNVAPRINADAEVEVIEMHENRHEKTNGKNTFALYKILYTVISFFASCKTVLKLKTLFVLISNFYCTNWNKTTSKD